MIKLFAFLAFVAVVGALIVFMKRKHSDQNSNGLSLIEVYGKSFNSERVKKGLPVIEESWLVRVADSTHVQWSHKEMFNRPSSPEHIWKTLFFLKSRLTAEEDAFNFDQGDSIGDRLIVKVDLNTSDSTSFKFSRRYYKTYPPSRSISVDWIFADSVLRVWGFPNYYETIDLE
jgi:hypothetical protein